MIYFLTGKPGSGKTLRLIHEAIRLVNEGREVYALNIRELNYEATGIKPAPIDHLRDWQQLPKGSVLIVDEVQTYLPPMSPNAAVPDWIEALTRNRHSGHDLYFVTQHYRLVNYYVRELVNYHEHVVRLEGNMPSAAIYSQQGLMELSRKGPPKSASFTLWGYPKHLYGVYKSADVHTVKRYIPQRLKLVAVGLVLVVVCVGAAFYSMSSITRGGKSEANDKATAPVVQQVASHNGASGGADPFDSLYRDLMPRNQGGERVRAWTTATEYAELHTPLIEGMPWTAQAYADRPVISNPEIYCISSEKRCSCLTEQGTKVYVKEAICRTIAREGIYNPYRQSHSAPGAEQGARSASNLPGLGG